MIRVIYGLHSIYVVFGIHGDPGVGSRLMVQGIQAEVPNGADTQNDDANTD